MRELKDLKIKEDATDSMKHQKLTEIDKVTAMLKNKINELAKLDNTDGATGAGDLTDQLVSFDKGVKYLMGVASRSHKIVPEAVEEASGEFADPIYDLCDDIGCDPDHPLFAELVKYLDGDTIRDFVSDYRRMHDMNDAEESVAESDIDQIADVGKVYPKIRKMKMMLVDKGMEPEEAHDKACEKYGVDPEMCDKYIEMMRDARESVAEAEGNKTIKVNKYIDTAGDSIWQGEKRGEEVVHKVYVHEITVNTDEDGYLSVTVKHEGPWTIYTDTGFEEEISGIIGHDVSFSEQGMQDDGMAHLEGEEETKQESTMEELDRILKIAGVQKAPVAEETLEEKCGCDDPKCDDPKMHEDEKVDEGEMPKGLKDYHDKKKKKSDDKTDESIDEAKKELDEEPNEGNEFAHELKKARDAGKEEFEVDGKKYKVKKESAETDEEVVAEAPTMDTTQLINLLKNSGLSEEAITKKLDEWANTPAGVGETEPTKHAGDANDDFAQAVNLSLKRYLNAQDLKINVNENHSKEGMKARYNAHKGK